MVIARYLDAGETIRLRPLGRGRARTADSFAHSPDERALIAFLDRHFPERRRRRVARRGDRRGARATLFA